MAPDSRLLSNMSVTQEREKNILPKHILQFFASVSRPARTKVKPQKEDLDQPLDRPAATSQV